MDPFTIISGIEACWKAGDYLMRAYEAWKQADDKISESFVAIEYVWIKTKLQIEVMQKVLTPDSEYWKYVENSASILSGKLWDAISAIDDVIKREPGVGRVTIKKIKYVLLKETIDKAVRDLEDWQRRFDPSWFLILRAAEDPDRPVGPNLDDAAITVKNHAGAPKEQNTFELAKGLLDVTSRPDGDTGVFLPNTNFDISRIRYSTAVLARRPASYSKALILDSIHCDEQADRDQLTKDVRLLASKLRRVDPLTFGLLNCRGVMKVDGEKPSFDFVFNTPKGKGKFRSLREALLDQSIPSLSQRLSYAKELTKSISYMHTFDFVHKNIRPETILLFNNEDNKRDLTFLVGFEGFRAVDGATAQRGDAELHRDLYRHPQRQGEAPGKRYSMEHDIYSLGVCLLEIGLWQSFVAYKAVGDADEPQPGPMRDQYYDWLKRTNRGNPYNPSSYLHEYFEEQARDTLPQHLGDLYANIVIKCLTCLNENDDDEYADVDEANREKPMIAAGVMFIQDILLRVDELTI